MSLTQEIEARIEKFVSELNELVRKQALDAVASALGTGATSTPARRGPGRPPKSANGAAAPAAAAKAPRARARKKGEKRSAAELAQLESSLESFVRSNPGQGIEAIGKAIGFPTAELARPMKKLVQRGSVRTEGEKRATKYYPGDGASAASAEGGEAAPKRRGRPAGKGAAKKKGKRK